MQVVVLEARVDLPPAMTVYNANRETKKVFFSFFLEIFIGILFLSKLGVSSRAALLRVLLSLQWLPLPLLLLAL